MGGSKEHLKVIKIEVRGKDTPYTAYGQYLVRAAGGFPYGMSEQGFYFGTSEPMNKELRPIFSSLDYAE